MTPLEASMTPRSVIWHQNWCPQTNTLKNIFKRCRHEPLHSLKHITLLKAILILVSIDTQGWSVVIRFLKECRLTPQYFFSVTHRLFSSKLKA